AYLSVYFIALYLFDSPVEADEDQEDGQPSEERPPKKLEEKQARKAQREVTTMLFSKAVCSSLPQEEVLQHAKEEQERKEEQEYQRLRECFVIEDQGEAEELSEQELRLLYFLYESLKSKVVLLEDLVSRFAMRTQDAISRLQDLIADGSLTGVIDVRGKFIFITPEELNAVAHFIKQRGRVSISELVQASSTLINLTPEIQTNA
uniref:DDRGK domain-containing protein 1 n=1 Tax=Cyprinus carpio TaxID=7962 RepID=A0A8C1UAZ6_CYPCA